MFAGYWHIVRDSGISFDRLVPSVQELPYTISFLIKKRMQIDSWMELPEDRRPPIAIWDKPSELEDWFDRVYGENTQTEFNMNFNENEVEE